MKISDFKFFGIFGIFRDFWIMIPTLPQMSNFCHCFSCKMNNFNCWGLIIYRIRQEIHQQWNYIRSHIWKNNNNNKIQIAPKILNFNSSRSLHQKPFISHWFFFWQYLVPTLSWSVWDQTNIKSRYWCPKLFLPKPKLWFWWICTLDSASYKFHIIIM